MRIRSFDANSSVTTAAESTPSAPQFGSAPVQVPVSAEAFPPDPSGDAMSAAARARQQRYEQLLRSGANAAPSNTAIPPVTKLTPPPSLLERMVKPIASALGINRSAPASQAMGSRPQQPQPQPDQPGTTDTVDPDSRDEDSDVTPPRLISAEFSPPQVEDGEQTTFIATVTDDLSGVKSVSGVLVSPGQSGAQQGFACQREGDTDRFAARITIPKEAAEGQWTIRYLTLTDNAGNTASLNSAQGALPNVTLKVVSSASDSKGPSLKAVWLEQQTMNAGDKNQVFVQAEDEKSGVNLVSGVFISPSKQARIGFGCRLGDGNVWQCPVTPPTCVDCGTWQLEQIQLQDKANNMTTVRADNAIVGTVRLELFGKDCDNVPPVITALSVDPLLVSNSEGGVVRITAIATDNQCGVASLSGVAMPPSSTSNTRIYFPFRPVTEGGDTFVGEIVVPKHAPAGLWTIGWIQALDKGHNLKAYSASDPVISRVTFRVK